MLLESRDLIHMCPCDTYSEAPNDCLLVTNMEDLRL